MNPEIYIAIPLDGQPVEAEYTNYRGERRVRRFKVLGVYWGETEHHPGMQWMAHVWDFDKEGDRDYAFSGFIPDGGAGRPGEERGGGEAPTHPSGV